MSSAEEALAVLEIAAMTGDPAGKLSAMRSGGDLSAGCLSILDDIQESGGAIPLYLIPFNVVKMANTLESYLAQRDEEEVTFELPQSRDEPMTVSMKLRSLLVFFLVLAGCVLGTGCSLRPRITSGGDTSYHSATTITIGELPVSGKVPDLAPLLSLARVTHAPGR